mmetsp:Transcript_59109/g.145049  ORF Transcript_59109/g.145049 Transcript_59109/m.145049 type:complete len:266 (-) Transcript_59109:4-801(-)
MLLTVSCPILTLVCSGSMGSLKMSSSTSVMIFLLGRLETCFLSSSGSSHSLRESRIPPCRKSWCLRCVPSSWMSSGSISTLRVAICFFLKASLSLIAASLSLAMKRMFIVFSFCHRASLSFLLSFFFLPSFTTSPVSVSMTCPSAMAPSSSSEPPAKTLTSGSLRSLSLPPGLPPRLFLFLLSFFSLRSFFSFLSFFFSFFSFFSSFLISFLTSFLTSVFTSSFTSSFASCLTSCLTSNFTSCTTSAFTSALTASLTSSFTCAAG